MKKFLLIIAVATAGLIPQVALCLQPVLSPPGFGEAAIIGPLLKARMDYPFMDVQGAAQSVLKPHSNGERRGPAVGGCPYAETKNLSAEGGVGFAADKDLDTDSAGEAR